MRWFEFLIHPLGQALIADSLIFGFLATRTGYFGEAKINKSQIQSYQSYSLYDIVIDENQRKKIFIRPIT